MWLRADERRAAGRDVADVGNALAVVPASAASDDRIFAAAARTCDQVTVERDGDTFIGQIRRRLDDLAAVVGDVTEAGHDEFVCVGQLCISRLVSCTRLIRRAVGLGGGRPFDVRSTAVTIRKGRKRGANECGVEESVSRGDVGQCMEQAQVVFAYG